MAFVPQHDQFLATLTVRECLRFASKIHTANGADGYGGSDHDQRVTYILDKLGLNSCADNTIGQCSGGQQKRLSIGQELLGEPDILVLDEPTSGLDSAATILVIDLLKELVKSKRPMAVALTIHQPSWRVLNQFDSIYALSSQGKTIYDGSPSLVMDYFSAHKLTAAENYNPGEFLIDVASGEYGSDVLIDLAADQEAQFVGNSSGDLSSGPEVSLDQITAHQTKHNFVAHCTQIMIR